MNPSPSEPKLIELPKEMFNLTLVQKSTEPKVHLQIRPIGYGESVRIPLTKELLKLMDGKSERWVVGSLDRSRMKFQIWEVKR